MKTQVEKYNETKRTKLVDANGIEILPGHVIGVDIGLELLTGTVRAEDGILTVNLFPLEEIMEDCEVFVIGWSN